MILVVYLQALFGVGFLGVGAVLAATNVRLLPFRGRARGRIIDLDDAGHPDYLIAAVAFYTRGGDVVVARTAVALESLGRIGDHIRVRYKLRDPHQVAIGEPLSARVLAAVWVLGLGVMLELLSMLIALLAASAIA